MLINVHINIACSTVSSTRNRSDTSEAAGDERVLRVESRAGLAHHQLQAREGLRMRGFDLAVVAQLLSLNAEVADDGLQRFLGLLEG